MNPSVVSALSGIRRKRAAMAVGVCVAAAVLVASAAASTSPTARACPSASSVKKVLKVPTGAPVVTKTQFSKTCTYPGGGVGSTKITFQVDTAKSFAASEKAAGSFGAKISKVKHLGLAAWTTGLGSVYVFDGHETISILALAVELRYPKTATAMVEALAHKLV